MKKRLFALLMAAVMLLGLVACADTSDDGPDGEYNANLQPGDPETWLSHDKVTLTVLTNEGSSTENPPPSNDLPFWKFLEEYTNVHIDWEVASAVGYTEVVSTRLSAGVELPDIMMINTIGNGEKAGDNGVLVDMAPYWDTHFTNTNAYWDAQGVDFESHITTGDGNIYALVGMAEPVEGHITLMYNTEWLKKLNKEVPTTLDEFTDLLVAMKQAGDLNGNGVNDEICFTAAGFAGLMDCIGTAFGLEQYESWDAFASKDGKVYSEYTSDQMRNFLEYLNKLFNEGILDKEIASMNASFLAEKIASDRVGVFGYYSSFAISYGQLTPRAQKEKDPYGEYFTLGVALASEYNNNKGYFMRRERAVGAPTAITTECDNVELACRWLDTLYADPNVLNVRQYGIEGEDWKKGENGEIEILYPADGSPRDISSKGCGQIPLCHFQTVAQLTEGMDQYPWYQEQYERMRTECDWKTPTVPHLQLFQDEEKEIMSMYNVDVKGVFGEWRAKFVTNKSNIKTEWDKYLQEMKDMGSDELTGAWQMVYDRTIGAQ